MIFLIGPKKLKLLNGKDLKIYAKNPSSWKMVNGMSSKERLEKVGY